MGGAAAGRGGFDASAASGVAVVATGRYFIRAAGHESSMRSTKQQGDRGGRQVVGRRRYCGKAGERPKKRRIDGDSAGCSRRSFDIGRVACFENLQARKSGVCRQTNHRVRFADHAPMAARRSMTTAVCSSIPRPINSR